MNLPYKNCDDLLILFGEFAVDHVAAVIGGRASVCFTAFRGGLRLRVRLASRGRNPAAASRSGF